MTEVSFICLSTGGGFGYIDYLVSSTADPTDPWRLNFLEYQNFLPDYPAVGTSTMNLAFAANVFNMNTTAGQNCLSGATFAGGDYLFADWAQVLRTTFTPPTAIVEWFFGPAIFTNRIAVQAPATSPTVHTVAQIDQGSGPEPFYFAFAGSAAANTLVPTAASELTDRWHRGRVGRSADFLSSPAPPPIVTTRIDSRPTDAIWQDEKLTWVSTHGCTPSGDLSLQACQRVTQIDTTGVFEDIVLPTAVQDFLIAGANKDNYYGGVGQALDGTLHVSWTTSDTTSVYPSSYAGYQLPGDPDNSLSPPELLQAGVGPSFTGLRWGDYNGVAQDPQVPNAVWQGNMYSGGSNLWKTFISQLQTGGSTFVPLPDPVRVLDTRPAFQIGLSGVFSHGVARELDRGRLRGGHPARGDRGHRQPDGNQPDRGRLRLGHPGAEQQPGQLDDQLPARRQPGQQSDDPGQRRRRQDLGRLPVPRPARRPI